MATDTKLYSPSELQAMSCEELDIIVAKLKGWTARPHPDEQGVWQVIDAHPNSQHLEFECEFEFIAWKMAHEWMMKPSTNGHAALLLMDEAVDQNATDLFVSREGASTSAPTVHLAGKPSVAMPRAITTAWILWKQSHTEASA